MAQKKLHCFFEFSLAFEGHFLAPQRPKTWLPKNAQTRNPQKRSVFANFGAPKRPNHDLVGRFWPWRASPQGLRAKLLDNLSHVRKPPIFLGFSPRRLAVGSLSALRGLLVTLFGPLPSSREVRGNSGKSEVPEALGSPTPSLSMTPKLSPQPQEFKGN